MLSSILTAGTIVGHYRVLDQLGEGGMGIVYRAHDERLGRDVALKFLPLHALKDENSRKRFHKEARVLAKLNHPNVATVYDFDSQDGLDFLVTEYIPGETLDVKLASAALRPKEVLRLGMQLADGLAAAHDAGILHRDLKPGNLQLTPDGRLKILDFGLAQFFHAPAIATTESVLDLPLAGTLPYQAPEQLQGEAASIRSDIYSAGAVLYEMCTGRRAFGDAPAFQVMHSIIHEPAKPPRELNPKIAPQLEQVVLKCLDKEPENRYQSAVELSVDIRRMSLPSTSTYISPVRQRVPKWQKISIGLIALVLLSALLALNQSWIRRILLQEGSRPIQSLAVLPLQNYSRQPDQDYFADGMTEELITNLAQISALRVISRTSIMTYKGSNKSLPQIAKELNVDAVLEGSVERFDHKVRVLAKLIQAKTDVPFWTRAYERNASDILTLQEEVAKEIADGIQIKLTAEELRRLNKPRVVDPQAHENYLQGRYYWNQRTKEDLEKSIEYLEKAIAEDPQYALAYAALSDSYHLLPDLAGAAVRDSFQKARSNALKALKLDPSLAEAHAAMAKVKEDYDWDWSGAEQEYKQAIELNPGLGVVHAHYSNLLAETGRISEALPEARKALELDPLSTFVNSNLASMLYFAGDYPAAVEQARKTLDLDPDSARAHRNLGRIYAAQGFYENATLEFQKAVEMSPGTPEYLAELGYTYGKWGRQNEAAQVLTQLQDSSVKGHASAYQLAVVYAGMGKKVNALRLLEKAVEERAAGIDQLRVTHVFDELRSEAAFQRIVDSVGL